MARGPTLVLLLPQIPQNTNWDIERTDGTKSTDRIARSSFVIVPNSTDPFSHRVTSRFPPKFNTTECLSILFGYPRIVKGFCNISGGRSCRFEVTHIPSISSPCCVTISEWCLESCVARTRMPRSFLPSLHYRHVNKVRARLREHAPASRKLAQVFYDIVCKIR